jgi:hypothetical protein
MIMTQNHNNLVVDSTGNNGRNDTTATHSATTANNNAAKDGIKDGVIETTNMAETSTTMKTTATTTTTANTSAAVYQRRNHSVINRHHSNGSHDGNSHRGLLWNHEKNHISNSSNGSSSSSSSSSRKESNNNLNLILQQLRVFQWFQTVARSLIVSSSSSSCASGSSTAAVTTTTASALSHQPQQQQKNIIRRTTLSIGGLCLLYLYVLYRTQYILDKHEAYFHGASSHSSNIKNNNALLRSRQRNGKHSVSSVQMIPISPMEMVRHSKEIQQLAQNLQSPETDPDGGRLLQSPPEPPSQKKFTTVSTTIISREPRQYLKHLQNQALEMKQSSSTTTTTDTAVITDTDLFIIYNADIPGQGTGNLMAGLLAAHLLGDEFHRIVCVNPRYSNSDFLLAFESINPVANLKCPLLLQQENPKRLRSTQQEDVSLINFVGAANECDLQNIMSDSTRKVIYLVANTYPRWPTVPNYYFLYYYQPTARLLEALPYTIQPTTVVHLRQPDDYSDIRDGLDTESLDALGKLLPPNESTFLVTNNVDFYERFTKCCHWSHPQWDVVQHSALAYIWGAGKHGSLNNNNNVPPDAGHNGLLSNVQSDATDTKPDSQTEKEKQKEKQYIQMWVDWYTLLMADDVYHTHSDFSISAIHWMNKKDHSFSIRGYNRETKQLETQRESWWVDGETIPVVERTIQGQPGTTNELRACTPETRKQTERRRQQQRHRRRADESSKDA